ncbi:hypothetical protein OOJ91_12105 [Micromonospora lupini]|uniref:hypothetical protein n=1 Tax=Micromonospora lupini TaxID=285679 RepID=UPI00224CCD4D|nr:hypothetical protein [Micromonospora lupini]MCX5066621.1 hypothetical protein [Micromonospora lupini]
MIAIRPGDQVTATVEDTAGVVAAATLSVHRVDRLECGCLRLVVDRPGPTPKPRGVHLLTGCFHGHANAVHHHEAVPCRLPLTTRSAKE